MFSGVSLCGLVQIYFVPEDGGSSFLRSENLKAFVVSLVGVVLVALPGGTKSDVLRNVPQMSLLSTFMAIMGRRASLRRRSDLSSCSKEVNGFCHFYSTTCSRDFFFFAS